MCLTWPCFRSSLERISSRKVAACNYVHSNFFRVHGEIALNRPVTANGRRWRCGGILLDTGMEFGNVVSRAFVRDILQVDENSLLPLEESSNARMGIDFNGYAVQTIGLLDLTFKLRSISGCIQVNHIGRKYHGQFFVTESFDAPFDIVLGATFIRDHHILAAAALPCVVPNTTADQEALISQTQAANQAERDANDAMIRDAERRRQEQQAIRR